MNTRELVRVLHRNAILMAAVMVVVLGLVSLYTFTQKPLYEAYAKVFVSTQTAGSVAELTQGGNFSQQVVKSYADIVDTSTVLQPVIDQLQLPMTVGELADRVTASAPLNTVVMEISVLDDSGARAAAIANEVSSVLSQVVSEVTPSPTGETSPVKITQVNVATAPTSPVSPRVPLNLALGALAALVLAGAAALLRESVDLRVRGQRDIEQVTDAAILGGIAYDKKTSSRPLIVQVDPRSPRAESFRSLRTNLQFLNVGRGSRTMVITSSLASEGKSTTAANLAIAVADAEQRVILVDADLRRPKVADYLGIDGSVGLTDVLIGRVSLEEAMQPWGDKKLVVLPAGRVPPNPSELLQSKELVSVISALKKQFGTVIFDAPPLLPVTDAAILARRTDGAIVVCAARRTRRPQLRDALAVLKRVEGKVLGVVITMLPAKGPDADGYGQYGYGSVYGEDPGAVLDGKAHVSPGASSPATA